VNSVPGVGPRRRVISIQINRYRCHSCAIVKG